MTHTPHTGRGGRRTPGGDEALLEASEGVRDSFSVELDTLTLNAAETISPTLLTRPHAQTWVWSAGGTAASTWLAELIARGRDSDPDVAYFEWAIPDDLEPTGPPVED